MYKDDEFLKGIKTIFTIHNFSYQGLFKKDKAPLLEVNKAEVETGGDFDYFDQLNLVKGALKHSDWVSTVSEDYAKEISSKKEFGYGLEKDLQKKKGKFSGILNGVDYSVWSPDTDKLLPYKYSLEDLSGKEQNKQALMTRINMAYEENTPLIGMISRIVEQKGYVLLLDALEELMTLNIQIVILGTGDKKLEKKIQTLQKKYAKKAESESCI